MSRLFRQIVGHAVDRSHQAYSGPARFHCEDRMADALQRRARWRLYADCERAPLDWEKRA